MAKTIANVLSGVATLSVREPNNARAEWSEVEPHVGDHCVKLSKDGTGDAGSTHVELGGATLIARGITMTLWTAAIDTNSFFFKTLDTTVGNYAQMEFRFEDPDSDAWAEITAVPLQGHTGDPIWVDQELADGDMSGIGGIDEIGNSFFLWVLAALSTQQGVIEGLCSGADCSNWILSRVRVELWEAGPERGCYVDSIEVMGTVYAIEPGGNAPGLSLSSPFREIGYTEDGVTMEYTAETTDIEVAEETVPIDRVLTKETISVTCNMAESSLYNIDKAMAGSVLSGSILQIGAGVLKTMNLKIEGTNPAGFKRAIHLPLVTATGTVGMAYKKGEKTVVPVSFQALKPVTEAACTVVDNAA